MTFAVVMYCVAALFIVGGILCLVVPEKVRDYVVRQRGGVRALIESHWFYRASGIWCLAVGVLIVILDIAGVFRA